MGLRFRKSFKVAPGVKINLNKKSSSVTFGGKGVHYTVNSKGKTTRTVGIPGTGLYYTETSGGSNSNSTPPNPPKSPVQNNMNTENNGGHKKRGCLFYLLAFLAICAAIAVYSYMWIPAIGFIIYFAVKKDQNKKRNIGISAAVLVTSLIVFGVINQPNPLTGIRVDFGETTFDISDTVEVKITPIPSDAEIDTLELSTNSHAELDYSDGKAVITFKKTGEVSLFFTANYTIHSNTTTITIIDKEAEKAQKEAEEAAAKKAQEEAKAKAEQEAAEQAAAEQTQAEQSAAEQEATEQPQEQMVWIPQSGSKYHSHASCSGMNNPTQVTISEAQSMGYEPCKKCY